MCAECGRASAIKIRMPRESIAIVYGARAGVGGLGLQAATAIASLARENCVAHAFGPGKVDRWPLEHAASVEWHEAPQVIPPWAHRYSLWRWYQGHYQLQRDRLLGLWATKQARTIAPKLCYVFTQVGLETLRWARSEGIPTVLDNPNGHIRHFREVCVREARQWCDSGYTGHPTPAMVERVEEEYRLADRIRVSSQWARDSMVSRGVPKHKIEVLPQPVDLKRFQPQSRKNGVNGPLRVCFVGILSPAKGFAYLTQAVKAVGAERAQLEIVGATGNRQTRRLFAKESAGILVTTAPGDPVPAYRRAELFVLPSLHDGFGFVVAEAMACGLPVVVTEDCGAASLVQEGESGWIVPAGKVEPLAKAMNEALTRRHDLPRMGRNGRARVEQQASPACLNALHGWVFGSGTNALV